MEETQLCLLLALKNLGLNSHHYQNHHIQLDCRQQIVKEGTPCWRTSHKTAHLPIKHGRHYIVSRVCTDKCYRRCRCAHICTYFLFVFSVTGSHFPRCAAVQNMCYLFSMCCALLPTAVQTHSYIILSSAVTGLIKTPILTWLPYVLQAHALIRFL